MTERSDLPSLREHRIINALLLFCLAAGFACFVLFALPDQLRRAAAPGEPPQMPRTPTSLAGIIPLEEEAKPPILKPHGLIARFTPDGRTSPEGEEGQEDPAFASRAGPLPDDDLVPGGAGAAIDDGGMEAQQALAYREPREGQPTATPPENQETAKEEKSALPAGAAPPEFKAYPPSSLARSESSALDGAKPKHRWLATPPGLEADVAFWRDIYAKHDRTKVVLHHPRRLEIVYGVVDVADILNDPRLADVEKQRMRENRVEERREEIAGILLKLADGLPVESLSEEERRIRALFDRAEGREAFRRAAEEEGVRSQTGQRDKFLTGLAYSGRYLGEIEGIFELYAIPREITRLIFVESMFNPNAVSSAGASGIWQFMPGTARLYLQMNDLVDERNDPIAATHAAAKLLRHNYEALGSWPLAINAYNAGRGRLQQAMARLGTTDIGRIIREFDHPAYGFASRNFFLEFLAALDVAEHSERFFGPIAFDPPLRYESVRLASTASLPDAARLAGISHEELLELNGAFGDKVASGTRPLPAGFSVRVPEKKGELFLDAAAQAPTSHMGPVHHVVQQGESLQEIARMYGVTPQQIVKSNRDMGWRVNPGQTIVVPVQAR